MHFELETAHKHNHPHMSASVEIYWFWIDINPSDTWKTVEAKLLYEGVVPEWMSRSVYVIRIQDEYSITYPGGHSPTLYIGEGGFKQRITSHRKWLAELYELTGEIPLEVAIAFPRVRNNISAHKVFEAHLLNCFFERYESLPLKNSNHEYMQYDHTYEKKALAGVIGPGSGKKYKWGLTPLKANGFFGVYQKTHKR